MDTKEIKKEIDELTELCKIACSNYHTHDNPIMSDSEYDKKINRLKLLEGKHPTLKHIDSPTDKVGGELLNSFKEVVFDTPMLSLGNAFNAEDLDRFIRGLGLIQPELVCEVKLDGIALNLIYINGALKTASTRGDGTKGEDVTENAKMIDSIPIKLLQGNIEYLEVRGEVTMPKSAFELLNKEREQGKRVFSNPRNAAAGSMRQLDPKEVGRRNLVFTPYEIAEVRGDKDSLVSSHHHKQNIENLQLLGFSQPYTLMLCINSAEVMSIVNVIDSVRSKIPSSIDGVVIKVNNLEKRKELGFNKTAPKWAIAYKFQAEEGYTKLEDVTYATGRTGVVTPVAVLNPPVVLGGVVVKMASLYNADEFDRLDLHLGDSVTVARMGDVIPKITHARHSEESLLNPKLVFATVCNSCQTPLVRLEGESATKCPNRTGCPAQISSYLEYVASRDCFDIKGLGPKLISKLFNMGEIRKPVDIFKLSTDSTLPEKTVPKKLKEMIEDARDTTLAKFIMALGIPNIGKGTSETLSERYGTVDNFITRSVLDTELTPVILKSIQDYLSHGEHVEDAIELANILRIPEVVQKAENGPLKDLEYVITGTIPGYSRSHLTNVIKANGGVVKDRVSTRTNFLIAGDNTSTKYRDATRFNIPILTETELKSIGLFN